MTRRASASTSLTHSSSRHRRAHDTVRTLGRDGRREVALLHELKGSRSGSTYSRRRPRIKRAACTSRVQRSRYKVGLQPDIQFQGFDTRLEGNVGLKPDLHSRSPVRRADHSLSYFKSCDTAA